MSDVFDLSGVEERVMRTRTQFPMEEWKPVHSTLKFLSVQWDAKYKHTVDWQSNEQRNQWFLDKDGWEQTLETGWNFKSLEVWKPGLGHHEGMVRVPFPYEEIMEYNYLFVEMGEQPVPGGNAPRREFFFYFITSLNKISPNTTELWLELDSWTTFRPSITIEGLSLLRGHYPHAQTQADEYLANPLANHLGLTEAEPDLPIQKPVVSSTNLVSFQKNGPRVCIATTADFTSPDSFWVDSKNTQTITNPSDVALPSSQWSERAILNNSTYSLGNGGLAAKAAVGATKASTLGGLYVYSIDPAVYASFIMFLRKRFPQAVKTIKAVYLLDSALIEEGAAYNFFGYNMKPVSAQNASKLVESFSFEKSMFGFEPEFADFAKLYTEQFSTVEISNLRGMKTSISVEDVAESLDVYSRVSTVFPFLKLEAFINGVGGKTKTTYAVKPLNSVNAELFSSEWEANLFDLEVPTYGVFAESREIEGVVNQIERYQRLKDANVAKAIATLEAETRKVNTTNSLVNDISNETLRINRDYSNDLARVTRDYVNENRIIDSRNYGGSQSISLDFSNANDSIAAEFANATQRISNDYSVAMQTGSVQFGIAMVNISAENSNALNTASNKEFVTRWGAIYDNMARGLEDNLNYGSIPSNELAANRTAYDILYENLRTVARRNSNLADYNFIVDVDDVTRSAQLGIMSSSAGSIGAIFNGASALAGGASALISSISTGLAANVKTMTMVRRLWGNSHAEDFDATINLTNGETTTFTGLTSALSTAFENERLQMKTEYDRVSSIIRNNSTESLGIMGGVRTIDLDAAREFALSTYNTETNNTSRTTSAAQGQASQTWELVRITSGWTQDTGNAIATRVKNTETGIANRIRSVNTAILDNEIAALRANSLNSRNVGTEIANRTRNVNLSINAANQSTGTGIISLDFSTAITNIVREYDSAIADLSASYNRMVFEEPLEYGDSTGSAWIDSWGHRGISVTVKRISKPSEQIVGRTFLLKGYRTEPLWIERPQLSLMTLFTYWEAESVRISGNPINETNKEIMRRILERGVTVWRDPELVNAEVDITNNKVGI